MFWVKLTWDSELHNYDVTQLQPIMMSRYCNELDLLNYELLSKNI